MTGQVRVAAIQMVSTPDVADNCQVARTLVANAAADGAKLVLLPEYWPIMGLQETDKIAHAEVPGSGPIQDCLADMASQHGIWVIGGTMPVQSTDPARILNTTFVYDPTGRQVARYDKIHLFSFSKGEESYDEARTIVPGVQPVAFETPFGRVGLSVCYDLRFPELYRSMGDCTLMVVPAAFTYTTGKSHWEVLLRSRAIENQCYVLACGQGGTHVNGRRTWGHSMLINPWGEVEAVLDEGAGVVAGNIDTDYLQSVRSSLPALLHRKL